MKIQLLTHCFILWTLFGYSQSTLPPAYQHVDQLLWIVDDLTPTLKSWQTLGFTQIIKPDTVEIESIASGSKSTILMAKANLGGANITLIQPLEGKSVFTTFHDGYGNGVMSLVHRFEEENYQLEVGRLSKLGVKILDSITFQTPKGPIDYILMDTYEKGKYVLGITFGDTDEKYFGSLSDENRHQLTIAQYAFAIENEMEVSAYWQGMGFPPVKVEPSSLSNLMYRGEPGEFIIDLAWQRHGKVPYEWVLTRKPPTVHNDHITVHGEGFQHLGYLVGDIDVVMLDYEDQGLKVSTGGTWGEVGKPGSGVFQYLNTESTGGVSFELLWPYRED